MNLTDANRTIYDAPDVSDLRKELACYIEGATKDQLLEIITILKEK